MSQEVNWKRALKQAAAVGLIFCVAILILLAGLIVTNYKHMGRFAIVFHLINSQYLHDVSGEELVDGAIEGMVNSLDPYSSFQDAEENRTLMNSIQGKFGGIGVHLNTADPDKLVIVRPIKGTPADEAGLEAGDIIIRIDNKELTEITQDQAIAFLRGEPGTKVTVGIYRPKSNEEFSVTLTRDYINNPTVEGKQLPGYEDIAIIDISTFSMQTGEEFERALKDLDMDKYRGLILDLRYNVGGEVNAAIKVASMLVPEGPIVHIVDNKGEIETKEATADYIDKPLVVLINEYTASASEIVAGAIKDNGSGTLVGTKTYGKGVVQTVFPLDDFTSVRLTTDKYLTPRKNDIHEKGIKPDIEVDLKEGEKPTIMPVEKNFDSQLQKALGVLLNKI